MSNDHLDNAAADQKWTADCVFFFFSWRLDLGSLLILAVPICPDDSILQHGLNALQKPSKTHKEKTSDLADNSVLVVSMRYWECGFEHQRLLVTFIHL